jgi:hypothetical protein
MIQFFTKTKTKADKPKLKSIDIIIASSAESIPDLISTD